MLNKVKLATVFSGIGSVEHALEKQNIPYEIIFACDNGEREIEFDVEEYKKKLLDLSSGEQNKIIKDLYDGVRRKNLVKETYFNNYNIEEERWFEDIRFINGKKFKNKIDLFVGGSPCQSFSIIGKRAGLEDVRGTLFYDFVRLIKETRPKVFIFENVLGMLSNNNGNTWKVVSEVFDSLDYKIYKPIILNSVDYGIPQNRKRLFVIGFKDHNVNFKVPEKTPLIYDAFAFLEKKNIDAKHYLGEKGFNFVTNIKYKSRARINSKIIQTQKANQQFNWNGDFVFQKFDEIESRKDILKRAYVGNWDGKKGVIRQMTHRECMRLMGYLDSFKISSNNVSAYRQSGNSIVVNVLEAILKEISKVVKFND